MLTRHTGRGRGRSGITLTEILISIMIMGVGIISLATLFPLGLLRLRNAQRLTRGAHLVESASSDLAARNLLAKLSFDNPFMSPWYTTSFGRYDPWVQDTPGYSTTGGFAPWASLNNGFLNFLGVYRGYGGAGSNDPRFNSAARAEPGLPVAYDPLWRAVTTSYPTYPGASITPVAEGRFGSGIGFLRADPNPGAGGAEPGAHGLQRVTNFRTYAVTAPDLIATVNYDRVLKAFVSPEDVVYQEQSGVYVDPNNGGQLASPSTVVPDLSLGGTPLTLPNATIYPTQNDWRFTWMFTGRRSDATDGATYDGDIVIHENRQFALDAVSNPSNPSQTIYQPAGETVVEAVWGYSSSRGGVIPTGNVDYGNLSAIRSVLLRWPATLPDPDVRVGGWIADVTYERSSANEAARRLLEPLQRCHWYQVTKKTDVVAGRPFGNAGVAYREMSVWVSTPLRARTPINFAGANGPEPYHVEAALIAPTVVNVYPWSGIIR